MRQTGNARSPVTIAAWAPNVIKRNADWCVRIAPLKCQIQINERAAAIARIWIADRVAEVS